MKFHCCCLRCSVRYRTSWHERCNSVRHGTYWSVHVGLLYHRRFLAPHPICTSHLCYEHDVRPHVCLQRWWIVVTQCNRKWNSAYDRMGCINKTPQLPCCDNCAVTLSLVPSKQRQYCIRSAHYLLRHV